jgi:hypothetical protein
MEAKYKKLIYGLICDALGMVSIFFPPFDFLWAPLSAYLMTRFYKGRAGKVAAVVSFVEEALPWVDIVPSFTLMWIYTYLINPEKRHKKSAS